MSILDYELLQAYTPKQYIPEDFKAYVNYGRIKIKINNGGHYGNYGIKIKFTKYHSYTDFDTLNNDKHIPLYYTVGTYETWRTGSTEAEGGAGGGWDYNIERKTNPYKWKRCYIDSECIIKLPEKLSKNNCAYIYFANCPSVNIEVKSTFPILGTHGMNDIELEGDFSSYYPKFKNSDFTSVKNVILNDSNTITSRSSMFANNKYLRYIPDCIKTLYTKNLNSNTNNAYYRMFENCTSLEEVTLNIIEDKIVYNIQPFSNTFSNCTSLRNIYIKYDYDKTKGLPCNLNDCVFYSPFENCTSIEKVSYNMDSPFDNNNSSHDWKYFGDNNNLFKLGLYAGKNIKSKYVSFPKFINGRVSPDSNNATDNDVAYEGACALGYYTMYVSYWGEYPWKVGHPNNSSMSDVGLGDYENSSLRTVHLFLGGYTGAEANYIGRLNNIPTDTRYSGLIDRINNFSKVDMSSNNAPYPVVSIGSIETFSFDGYIIGSVRDWDEGVGNYTTTLYKLYNCDSNKYVKVTDAIENSTTLCFMNIY